MLTRWMLGLLCAIAPFAFAAGEELKVKVCEVHQETMVIRKVPIQYGLPLFTKYDEKMQRAETKLFPHAADYALGGCEPMPEKTVDVLECAACRVAKETWMARHPRPKTTESESGAARKPAGWKR